MPDDVTALRDGYVVDPVRDTAGREALERIAATELFGDFFTALKIGLDLASFPVIYDRGLGLFSSEGRFVLG